MKKLICLLMVTILIFSISACSSGQSEGDSAFANVIDNSDPDLLSEVEMSSENETADETETSGGTETTGKTETSGKTEAAGKTGISDKKETTGKTETSGETEPTSKTEEINKLDTPIKTETTGKTDTSSETDTTSSPTEESVQEHSHNYTKTVVAATCASKGYTEYKCNCGSSYKDNYTSAKYAHNFSMTRKNLKGIIYDATLCTNCGLEVFAYGNADGSIAGGNNKVKFYVTGKVSASSDGIKESDYHIVIYGKGAMPDFEKASYPRWYEYLNRVTKISIAEGITTIGKNAFNYPDGYTQITFNMSDSVKTIKHSAINLNMSSITLGKGVERVEYKITGKNMRAIYLPKTLKHFGGLGSSWDNSTVIYYEGTKEEFLKITLVQFTQTVTVKSFLDDYFSYDVYSPYWHVYLDSAKIFDNNNYFDTFKEWQ